MNVRQNWSSLAAAVINMAIRDLRKVRVKVESDSENKAAKADLDELEGFFGSEWFRNLLAMSGIEADDKKIKEIVYGC